MKSKTRLNSAVFQLTPTRTRYDLVINANGKTEKMGSGLVNPFLAHLKTAQQQIAKGGYSITLEPPPGTDAMWFTKATMARFVRFVSTPEVLERVNTIESEILQIEESIAIQSNDNLGLNTIDVPQRNTEKYSTVSGACIEGCKPILDADAEKAIVLYKPGAYPPESNGCTVQEESSKVQLLKVLETRKTVLHKEQGMAFARAVAAGFDMDHIVELISFGECFGATRLIDACLSFFHLWKEKHETGQWLEIESPEAMSNQSDFSSFNAAGTLNSIEAKKNSDPKEVWSESISESGIGSNGKATDTTNADKRLPTDAQVLASNQDYFQGQFQHPMFSQWPTHSPPGAPPLFQGYPMQGMPYYHSYPAGPFFQSPYPPVEDPRFSSTQKKGQKSNSDSKDSNTESEDVSELEKEGSQCREQQRNASRPGKKPPGMVVIRNINYITSKGKNTSGSESESASQPETEDETEDLLCDSQAMNHKKSWISPKNDGIYSKSTTTQNSYVKDDNAYGYEKDGGSWQAFQKCLLREDNVDTCHSAQGLFSMEREAKVMRGKNQIGSDPIVRNGKDLGEAHHVRTIEFDTISGKVSHMLKASTDEMGTSGRGFDKESRGHEVGVHLAEIEGGRGGYRKVTNDDFIISRRETQMARISSQSDPLAENLYEHASYNVDKRLSHDITDESFIVPLRSSSQDQIGTNRQATIDMDAEFPPEVQKAQDLSGRGKNQVNYEPDDLSLMPERGVERESNGYDLSVDYEMQLQADNVGKVQISNQKDVERPKKLIKDKKLKGVQDSAEKRKMIPTLWKGKPSKFSHSNDAQARAEKLRAFKADLQKMKKEKEEEEAKRLEALKRERQKRIAARGNSSAAPQLPSQTKPRSQTKLSPSSQRGSKFRDLEPGSSSPLQKLPLRTASMISNDSEKIIKPSKHNKGNQLAGNGLSRSVSSLPELKEKDSVIHEPKVTMARIRRLSEPKKINSNHVSSLKSRSTEQTSKSKVSNGYEIKKISAIMSLDRTKAATLPELKIRASKGPSDIIQNQLVPKDLKENGNMSSVTCGTKAAKGSNQGTSYNSREDENPVLEKTVVMQEGEKASLPIVQGSEEKMERKGLYVEDIGGKKTELVSEYTNIHAPVSPQQKFEVDQNSSDFHLDGKLGPYEIRANHSRDHQTNSSSTTITAEKQYQAPYARSSSLEDRFISNLDHTNAHPTSIQIGTNIETANVYVSNFRDMGSIEKRPVSSDKPWEKESSKGFRKLLKFGKKNPGSSAGERVVESDKLSSNSSLVDDHATSSASFEAVDTLKNLISQDETPTAGSQQKASRSFSLLSPFRSKTSEKKVVT